MSSGKLAELKCALCLPFVSLCFSSIVVCVGACVSAHVHRIAAQAHHFVCDASWRRAQTISGRRFTFTSHRYCCAEGAADCGVVWIARVAMAMTPTRQRERELFIQKWIGSRQISNAILAMRSASTKCRSVARVREMTRSTRPSFMASCILARWRATLKFLQRTQDKSVYGISMEFRIDSARTETFEIDIFFFTCIRIGSVFILVIYWFRAITHQSHISHCIHVVSDSLSQASTPKAFLSAFFWRNGIFSVFEYARNSNYPFHPSQKTQTTSNRTWPKS